MCYHATYAAIVAIAICMLQYYVDQQLNYSVDILLFQLALINFTISQIGNLLDTTSPLFSPCSKITST